MRAGAPNIEGLGTLSVRWYNPPDTAAKSSVELAANGAHRAVDGDKDSISIENPGWITKRPVRGDDADEVWDDDEDGGGRRRR